MFDSAQACSDLLAKTRQGPLLPEGTSVTLEFRGATDVSGGVGDATTVGAYGNQDASSLNPSVNVNVTFLNGDDDWKPQASDIDGARFFQFRLTQVSNIASLQAPRVRLVAVPFRR